MTVLTIDNCDRDRAAVESLINSIVLAFKTDPIVRWMYPAEEQYQKNFPNFVNKKAIC